MSWRVITTSSGWADVERLESAQRTEISVDLMAWVEDGPPRQNWRTVFGMELFEDDLPSGYRVSYLVGEAEQYIAVVRVRRT